MPTYNAYVKSGLPTGTPLLEGRPCLDALHLPSYPVLPHSGAGHLPLPEIASSNLLLWSTVHCSTPAKRACRSTSLVALRTKLRHANGQVWALRRRQRLRHHRCSRFSKHIPTLHTDTLPGSPRSNHGLVVRLRLPAPLVADRPLWEDSRDLLHLPTLSPRDRRGLFISHYRALWTSPTLH